MATTKKHRPLFRKGTTDDDCQEMAEITGKLEKGIATDLDLVRLANAMQNISEYTR